MPLPSFQAPTYYMLPHFAPITLMMAANAFVRISAVDYCVARHSDNLEQAALCSLNGGGQNTQRTALVCALMGGAHGLSAIPARWLEGLEDGAQILAWAKKVAEDGLDPQMRSKPADRWGWQQQQSAAGAKL